MRLTKKFVCEFIHNSNAIEGLYHDMLYIEKAYDMVNNAKTPIDTVFLTNHPEIFNTLEAISFVKKNKKKRPALDTVAELHRITMRGLMPMRDEGCYRAMNVIVGGSQCPQASQVLILLNQFLEKWNDKLTVTFPEPYEKGIMVPSKILGEDPFFIKPEMYDNECLRHMEFERIHPFSDGNGRTGRLLYLWDCLYHGKKFKIILAERKFGYYAMLNLYRKVLLPTLWVSIEEG